MKEPFNQTDEAPHHEAYFHEADDRHTGLILAEFREGIAFGAGLAGVEGSCFLTWPEAQIVADTLAAMLAHGTPAAGLRRVKG